MGQEMWDQWNLPLSWQDDWKSFSIKRTTFPYKEIHWFILQEKKKFLALSSVKLEPEESVFPTLAFSQPGDFRSHGVSVSRAPWLSTEFCWEGTLEDSGSMLLNFRKDSTKNYAI